MIAPLALAAWAVAALAVVAAVVLVRRKKRRGADRGIPIAHRERLTELPAYQRALLRIRILVGALVVMIVLLIGSSAVLTARPATVTLLNPELHNRDIVLCLDVSGSMIAYDAAVIEVFEQLADEFTGERISMVVFNASAVTYFPLTNDYDYIVRQLERLAGEFENEDASYFSGTLLGNGSSLVGDGLASCVTRFDNTESERSRSIIFVTDNFVSGEEIFTLPEAAALAADRGVRVYGINPGDASQKDYLVEFAVEFEQAMTESGGAYYALEDPAVVPEVVDSITAEQAAVIPGAAEIVKNEHPEVPILVAFAVLAALMGLAWRLKR
jgi:hypothetical protein